MRFTLFYVFCSFDNAFRPILLICPIISTPSFPGSRESPWVPLFFRYVKCQGTESNRLCSPCKAAFSPSSLDAKYMNLCFIPISCRQGKPYRKALFRNFDTPGFSELCAIRVHFPFWGVPKLNHLFRNVFIFLTRHVRYLIPPHYPFLHYTPYISLSEYISLLVVSPHYPFLPLAKPSLYQTCSTRCS